MLRLLRKSVPVEETSEEALVRRAQGGEADAFRVLFERNVSGVRRFLGDLLKDGSAADEATQETFVRAHALLGRLKDRVRLQGFLLGIARNVAFEHHRRGPTMEYVEDDATIEAVLPAPDPESLMLDRELELQFAGARAALKPERRAALLMRVDHGLAYEEIAEAMGWSLPTVKNEIHRARLKLRQLMLPHVGGRS
ncbi:MAG: subfamily polymerase sigma factor [Myxococcaceae bacterium]|nr:subfamily polymerase sigma factor [Myxococcaceae bacterium]